MIYLDNAATTWPKPPGVERAMVEALHEKAANPGRGSHSMSLAAGRMVYRARELLARLFNIRDPCRVVFTLTGAMEELGRDLN